MAEAAITQSAVSEPIKLIDENQPELDIPSDKFPLERYKPISIMGSGASGVVYQCVDRMLNKRVAIKSLHVIERSQLVAFQREAITTSNLRHDNVVKILDFGATEGGSPYMVMDFVHGVDLQTRVVEKGPLSQWQAVYLTYKLAQGLAHAHSQEIFHRDIKSSNILVTVDPTGQFEPVLIDFGVAQFKTGNANELDKTGIVGSPLYMAPDQAMGREYDARSEIYSLGCCLFETLTGTVPFQGNSALETMSMHAHHEPPTLADALQDSSIESEFNHNLERLVATCLAKDPDSRYQSAQQLASALKEILDSGELVPTKEEVAVESPVFSELVMPRVSGTTKVIAATVAGLLLVGLSTLIFNRTFHPQAQIIEKKFEVNGLDDFGLTTEKTLLGKARAGPFADTVNWDFIEEPGSDLKKKPGGGTFQQYVAPSSLGGTGKEMMTVGEGEVTDADLAKLKGKKIDFLIVHSRYINGSGLKYLIGTGIRSLDIGHSSIDENGMKELAKLTDITSLNLEFNPVTDRGLSYIANLPLHLLVLKRTTITDKSMETIRKISSLMTLTLSGTAVTKDGIMSLKDMPNLQMLDCSKMTSLSDLDGIEKFHLKHLVLADTSINDRTIAQIVKIPTITRLILDKTKITDFMFGLLPRLKQLERISVMECEGISEEAIERFRRKNPQIEVASD